MFDVHFHPTEEGMDRDLAAVLLRAQSAGVQGALATAVDEESAQQVLDLTSRFPAIAAAIGYHPWLARRDLDFDLLERLCRTGIAVAIGEIGLDGKVEIPLEVQRECFDRQLELARKFTLPVVVHSRGAHAEVLARLENHRGVVGVMHAFSGDTALAGKLLDLGMYFSFVGTVTRPKAKKVQALARLVPDDRLLLETDAPSIGMEGVPPEKVEPCHLPLVARALASLRGTSFERISALSDENAARLFGAVVGRILAREQP